MEQAKGHFGNNILTVLLKTHNADLQTAANMVGKHFSELVKQFNEDKETLFKSKPTIAEQLKRHIYSLECWVSGNLYWSFHSKRYFGERHEEVMQTRVVNLTPTQFVNGVGK